MHLSARYNRGFWNQRHTYGDRPRLQKTLGGFRTMAVVRWDPFRDLSMLQDRMNQLFDDAGRGWRADEPAATTTWSPAVDIFETEGEIVVKAELPGMDRNNITLNLEK